MLIHAPSLAELPTLRSIELAAGAAFRELGMAAIADAEPPTLAHLTAFHRSGRALAAYEEPGGTAATADTGQSLGYGTAQPLGYLLWEPVDGCTHIEQVSVHPRHAHRRIGQALIDRAEREGSPDPLPLTLTTFAEVPWNAPYYARLGFRILTDAGLTPGLRAIRAREATLGLDRWPRVCMRREVDGARACGADSKT
ncbi:GNAT family N-acetyltransferase [Streptomyces lydicus]|uniref:GNAT family N-acetyltransferase n=1 Tax=Streptomyces lydicus TaxID=47763 RepID=UPI0010104E00|nr:GNAT family N-acetyltransferase [Streptomyces lydicus]MCZ1006612.1 GNAT family N-acetyltransferase [Streptomyces lydicus]